jgi:hypothetical protein
MLPLYLIAHADCSVFVSVLPHAAGVFTQRQGCDRERNAIYIMT